jgi:hypothetical protein
MGAFKRANDTVRWAQEQQRQAEERRRRESAELIAEAEKAAREAAERGEGR